MKKPFIRVLFMVMLLQAGPSPAHAQNQRISSLDRDRAVAMLNNISRDIQKHYYDPDLHGLDWDSVVKDARKKIESSDTLGMALAHIAQALVALNDSHTFLIPPRRQSTHDYGFVPKIYGSECYVSRVRPESDAAQQGLKPGDQILSFEGVLPQRDNFWKVEYRFNLLRPVPLLTLNVQSPEAQPRQVQVKTKFKQLPPVVDLTGADLWGEIRGFENELDLMRPRWAMAGDDIAILNLPSFMIDRSVVAEAVRKARKSSALILDLRGNPGGSVDSLRDLLSGLFDKDVKIADRVGRKEQKPELAKSWGSSAFTGKLVVLVDSNSASAAELLARVVQLEKRGTVIGDETSGSVMEARHFEYSDGNETKVFYAASITESDLIMSDGKSLEHQGVTPDEIVLPTADDLAAGRDPVLSRAVELVGGHLNPVAAGRLFPYEWPKE